MPFCQIVVYQVHDDPPSRSFPHDPTTRWRFELWDGDVFLTARSSARSEVDAHKQARDAAEALGYTP